MAIAIILFLIQYHRRQTIHQLEKAALQHTFDNQLLLSRLETQEQAFQYFSEEIHDNVGQVLSVVGMYLYQLREEFATEHAQRLVGQSSELLNNAIGDLRAISHTLNAQFITRAGLVEALNQEIQYINSVKGIRCILEVHGGVEELESNQLTMVFRIIQEAISNAIKHASSSEIGIYLNYGPCILSVSIVDNGKGFDATSTDSSQVGLGLTNMQLRAKLLGSTLQIQSKPGAGTKVSLSVQINQTKPMPDGSYERH